MRQHRALFAGAAVLVLTLGLLAQKGDESAPELIDDGRPARLETLDGNDCLECHATIGLEWRESMHALAWEDPHYQKELKGIRRKKSCYGCHVPKPMDAQDWTQKPEPRAESRHLGVDCVACHLAADGETILGPDGFETDAHPTRKSELFDHDASNTICIACHATTIGPLIGIAKDFVETEQTDLGLSCVGCHMPQIKRASANDDAGTEYPVRAGRNHRLMTPRDPLFLRKAFVFRAAEKDGRTVLTIENACGHRVPGLLERKIHFRAKVVDDGGKEVATGELTIDNRAYLAVDDLLELAIEGTGATLELVGTHEAPGVTRPVQFLERAFDIKK
jgi:hypothetical protein